MDRCFPAEGAGYLEAGLGIVDQVVALRHVLGDAESIDQTVNEFLVRNWLTKVIQLGADPVEVVQITSEGVTGLDGAVQLRLECLNVVEGIILVGV